MFSDFLRIYQIRRNKKGQFIIHEICPFSFYNKMLVRHEIYCSRAFFTSYIPAVNPAFGGIACLDLEQKSSVMDGP